jgi:hypothetical protein
MKTLERDILSAMLGRLYGTFEPINPFRILTAKWAWQHRLAYLGRYNWTHNVGLLPRPRFGGDATANKREQRAYVALEGMGLVLLQKKLAGLTAEGMREARKTSGMVQLEDSLPGLDFILSKWDGPEEWIDRRGDGRLTAKCFVSEASMAGFGAMPKGTVGKPRCECAWVPDCLMPLLVSGLVEFDYQPDFELPLYRLTEEGEVLAHKRKKTGKADPAAWLKLSKWKYGDDDAQFNEFESTKREMEHARPIFPNCIQHQMSGCTWPRELLDGSDA